MNGQTEDQILDDLDTVIAEIAKPNERSFPDIINQWTDALLEENANANPSEVLLIMRLGLLGQRLIYEANAIGQNDMLRYAKERAEAHR